MLMSVKLIATNSKDFTLQEFIIVAPQAVPYHPQLEAKDHKL
jgi:hypothetical protein